MEKEITIGDIYEEVAERLAEARTKALMGEHQIALGLFHGAALDFMRFREVLESYPGFHALQFAFDTTMNTLMAQEEQEEETAKRAAQKFQTRRKMRKAA